MCFFDTRGLSGGWILLFARHLFKSLSINWTVEGALDSLLIREFLICFWLVDTEGRFKV